LTHTELKQIRRLMRLTQAGLGALLGVARITVYCWECGRTKIPEPVARLAQRIFVEFRDVRPQSERVASPPSLRTHNGPESP